MSKIQAGIVPNYSLGYYLPLHPPGFFRFRMDSNTLIVTGGHTKAFKRDDLFCCGIDINIMFNSDILSIESSNGNAKKIDNRTVLIRRSRRQLIKGKKKTDLTIKIK